MDRINSPIGLAERVRLRRWLAAVGLTSAAVDVARVDTPETNAMALLGAHAACEALLGLVARKARHKPGEEVSFSGLLTAAGANVQLHADLVDDLDAMHRMRNDFVHASNVVASDEVARAISNSRRLLELAMPDPRMSGIPDHFGPATAVAELICVEPVGIWLRDSDKMRSIGLLDEAADGLARALHAALLRTRPRLLPFDVSPFQQLARIRLGLGPDRDEEAMKAGISSLHRWVMPLALGVSPAAYERLVALLGSVPHEMPLAPPAQVFRGKDVVITEPELRSATAQTAEIVFRLWAMGSLRSGSQDDQVAEQARTFIETRSISRVVPP